MNTLMVYKPKEISKIFMMAIPSINLSGKRRNPREKTRTKRAGMRPQGRHVSFPTSRASLS